MSRLTTIINGKVYYNGGKYPPSTLIAEMETQEIRECMIKLAEYENKDEQFQGRIIEVPCKLGDTVKATVNLIYEGKKNIPIQGKVTDIITLVEVTDKAMGGTVKIPIQDFGKTAHVIDERSAKESAGEE